MRTIAAAIALFAAAAGGLIASSASACSVAPGYRVPTNLELAGQANLILIGEVVGERPALEDDPMSAGITVRPVAALKGLLPGDPIAIAGTMLAPPGSASPGEQGDPLDFAEPHPSAYAGGCIRREFAAGSQVLFFLDRRDGQWVPAGGAFSRWAEDASAPEEPWVQLATLYAHASQLTAEERTALLEDQLEALQAQPDNAVALAMAGDIERVLAGPNDPLVAELPPAPEDSDVALAPEPAPDSVEAAIDNFGAAQSDAIGEEP